MKENMKLQESLKKKKKKAIILKFYQNLKKVSQQFWNM